MFFGLTNSPATFCRAMARMFRPLTNKFPTELFVYMDDILIATKNNVKQHCEIVDVVLDLLAKESYFLRLSKCVFEQTHIEYLGVIVNGNTLSINPAKAESLQEWPQTLTKVKDVRSILGVLGYQCPFIPNYADIAKPLMELTKKDQPFIWTHQCRQALDTLINIVLTNPALLQPDTTKPFFLQVDASAFATGAILTQKDHRGKHAAVGFHSQTFSDAECYISTGRQPDLGGANSEASRLISRYLSWGIYCKVVPVYIAKRNVFKLSSNMKHKPYQPIVSIHQATGAYQYHIQSETRDKKIRTASRHIQPWGVTNTCQR